MPPAKPTPTAEKEKNEYIPTFITQKPFYVDDNEDYLDHQRLQDKNKDSKWYDRGKKLPAATKFRKGACENCGSMSHKAKDCLSRPRAKGAKWTGKNIQADEVVQNVDMGWDAKRDRWNGFDPKEYRNVVEERQELDSMKAAARGDSEAATDSRYLEESDMGRQQSTATRNLRLREDTAKYLVNLDLDSAKYDPKSRQLVDGGATADATASMVAEDNFERASGDAAAFEKARRYAWEQEEATSKAAAHLQANPTVSELTHKKHEVETKKRKDEERKKLLDRYGESTTIEKPVEETGAFVEYDEGGQAKSKVQETGKSKYEEDVFPQNHTSVWGSWWKDFRWGYKCCHSTVRNSYCTGIIPDEDLLGDGGDATENGADAARDAEAKRRAENGDDDADAKRARTND